MLPLGKENTLNSKSNSIESDCRQTISLICNAHIHTWCEKSKPKWTSTSIWRSSHFISCRCATIRYKYTISFKFISSEIKNETKKRREIPCEVEMDRSSVTNPYTICDQRISSTNIFRNIHRKYVLYAQDVCYHLLSHLYSPFFALLLLSSRCMYRRSHLFSHLQMKILEILPERNVSCEYIGKQSNKITI